MIWANVLALLLVIILAVFDWRLGLCAMLLLALSIYWTLRAERVFRKEMQEYVNTISHRVKRASHEVITELPIGILLFGEDKVVEWHNPFVGKMVDRESLVGEHVADIFPGIKLAKDKEGKVELAVGKRHFQVIVKPEERLLYFIDNTEYTKLHRLHEDEKPVLGIVMLDNLDEATQGLDDHARAIMLGKVTSEISEWAAKHHLYLRRTASDRYLFITTQLILKQLEQSRFEILDEAREHTLDHKLPITLSMGIAAGSSSLIELGTLAQSSLDIALGRGGDQVAVKVGDKLTFYGGKSNAVEKRTRVRARVISHALRDLIRESDNVLIVGHRIPDMDAIGAAIGVMKAVRLSGKEGHIVLEGINPSIERLMEEIEGHAAMEEWFLHPELALQRIHPRTLLVVVDTHKGSMIPEPKLLQMCHRVVVIDHHRRSEEFINDALLVYMEPYASSTCELVTELLQYYDDRLSMDPMEATAIMAGIVVDTKSFAVRTGARTFEAASFLRRNGADTAMVQRLMKEDLDEYLKKADMIKHARIVYDHIAIAASEPGQEFTPLLVAQAADTLLSMTGIAASFVIAGRPDGLIGISARSMGEINVQLVMERMGGGGHLTNAAVQLEGTVEQVEEQLLAVLNDMHKEEGLFE